MVHIEKDKTATFGHYRHDTLPKALRIFPLHGVLLLPGGYLPLNVFEPHYLTMVDDVLASEDRLIGMIQTRDVGGDVLYGTGCAGRITEFRETGEGRYEIMLSGISRFDIADELDGISGYRVIRPNWAPYESDLDTANKTCLGLDRSKIKSLVQKYFEREGMDCDWDAFDDAPDGKLMTCLAMACPIEPVEKQALIEEKSCKARAEMFITMLEMELYKS
jgi:hypothetical protein